MNHLVAEYPPREVGHRFEAVVDEELRSHRDETEEVNGVCQGEDQPRVPGMGWDGMGRIWDGRGWDGMGGEGEGEARRGEAMG